MENYQLLAKLKNLTQLHAMSFTITYFVESDTWCGTVLKDNKTWITYNGEQFNVLIEKLTKYLEGR